MGIFSKLRRQDNAVVMVKPEELPFYFNQAAEETFIRIKSRLEPSLVELRYHLRKAKEYSKALRDSFPPPAATGEDAAQHQQQLGRASLEFLESITLADSVATLFATCHQFHETYPVFEEELQRHLFGMKNQSTPAVQHLRQKLDMLNKGMIDLQNALESADAGLADKLQHQFRVLDQSRRRVEEIHLLQDNIDEQKAAWEEKAGTIRKRLQQIKETRDYELYQQLKERQDSFSEQRDAALTPLNAYWNNILPALTAFEKDNGKKRALAAYKKDLSQALSKDKKLAVVKALQAIRKQLEKKEGQAFPEPDQALFVKAQQSLASLDAEQEEVDRVLAKNMAILNVKEQSGWLKITIGKMNQLTKEWQELEYEKERLNISLQEQRIAEQITKLSGRPHKILR